MFAFCNIGYGFLNMAGYQKKKKTQQNKPQKYICCDLVGILYTALGTNRLQLRTSTGRIAHTQP